MTAPLRTLPLCTFVLGLICSLFITIGNARDSFALIRTCLTHWYRALRGARPVGSRFKHSAFHRLACLTMIMVMSVQGVLASPQVSRAAVHIVSATAVNAAQDAHLWWHSSGWAARSERFMRENFPNWGANAQRRNWDGKGAPKRAVPKPKPQETQEARNGRVARVDISPREATIAAGQEIQFIAVAYDADNSPIGGVPFDWDNEDEDNGERISAEEKGRFSSAKEGNYW